MSTDIDYIKVDNYQRSKKKKSRKKSKSVRTLIAILLFLLLAATVVFFIFAGNNDRIDVTDGADSAYVPLEEVSEGTETASPLPVATPAPPPTPTPAPIPTPTPTPINNNPSTGTVFLRKYSDEACTVSIKNNLDKDCCVVITHVKSETDAVIVFVRSGEECDVKTPNGTYKFTAKSGDVYLSADSYFGSDTETIDLGEVSLPWGETHSISING